MTMSLALPCVLGSVHSKTPAVVNSKWVHCTICIALQTFCLSHSSEVCCDHNTMLRLVQAGPPCGWEQCHDRCGSLKPPCAFMYGVQMEHSIHFYSGDVCGDCQLGRPIVTAEAPFQPERDDGQANDAFRQVWASIPHVDMS